MSTTTSARLLDVVPSVVLAIYAHPDDADVSCGGTLARWSDSGAAVHLVVITDGGKGTIDPDRDPSELASVRVQEVRRAAAVLGVRTVDHLAIPDGEVPEQQWLTGALVERIRRLRPDVVMGHDPTSVFFGSVYVNHRDHRASGWALLDAVAPASGMPHYYPEAGPPFRVPHLLLSGTLAPDSYVEITETIDRKIDAVAEHRSQLAGDSAWAAATIRSRASDDGRLVGVAFAEGFRHLELNG